MSSLVVGKRFNPYRSFTRISVIPNELMAYPGLSSSAKLLWARLAQYAGKDGRAYPSIATLAADIGLKERQTQNLLAELKKKRFIESSHGPRANSYYFLLHPCLVDGFKQDIASSDAKKCLPGVQETAPKETKKENQRKETTKKKSGRRLSFSDLSKKQQRYIELKTECELAKGKIHTSSEAFRAGLVNKAIRGKLDISGLDELEAWKIGKNITFEPTGIYFSSTDKDELRAANLDRIRSYVKADERSTNEICGILKKQAKEWPPKGLWGLPYQSVMMGLKELFPESW